MRRSRRQARQQQQQRQREKNKTRQSDLPDPCSCACSWRPARRRLSDARRTRQNSRARVQAARKEEKKKDKTLSPSFVIKEEVTRQTHTRKANGNSGRPALNRIATMKTGKRKMRCRPKRRHPNCGLAVVISYQSKGGHDLMRNGPIRFRIAKEKDQDLRIQSRAICATVVVVPSSTSTHRPQPRD